MHNILEKCLAHSCVQPFITEIQAGSSLLTTALAPSMKACLVAAALHASGKSCLILTGTGPEEFKLFNDLPLFCERPLIELLAWETVPAEQIAPSPDIVGSRYHALCSIAAKTEPVVVLSSLQASLQRVVSRASFQTQTIDITTGMSLTLEELTQLLQELGYERKTMAYDKGEMAVRGGIVDIFPVTHIAACRIEFWGDRIDSIRTYDPASQKSTGVIDKITITPAQELQLLQNAPKLETIFDFLGKDTLVILDDLEALEDRYASLTSLGAKPSKLFLGIEELFDSIQKYQTIFFTKNPIEQLSTVTLHNKQVSFYAADSLPHTISFEMFQRTFSPKRWVHPFETVGAFLARECLMNEEPEGAAILDALAELPNPVKIECIVQNETEEVSLKQKLHEREVIAQNFRGYLSQGFVLGATYMLFSGAELTGRIKVRREQQRSSSHFDPIDVFDIAPGETVVHYHHGIGKYLGIEKKPNNVGVVHEFFLIEYADKARMYVPLTQAHLINKYIAASGDAIPKLHTIGSSRWKKQRQQTEKAIQDYAKELLKMYAERKLHGGIIYPHDSDETRLFEEEFPYIETDDQLRAINDVKSDMTSPKAMDRLICGDVGYGKTEVALRAAFKAVVDGKKQVAVLVPTTVLAVQHYENFVDRMQSFGCEVAILSRFQTAKETKATIEKIEKGSVDVVIGTHKILQDKVRFKDLGLIIIDEEQRFGVKAKEYLKKLKTTVDCLTLSATPIPRTLYLSVVGARDLSVINTPPQDRLPIKTVIAEPDDVLIQTALLRELSRDGQAYFIHNRVESIFEAAARLQRLLPKARIVVGHGQMDGDEIDMVFHAFKKGEANILVATSIIENGIDIPNANTIIIDNAYQFGMSDLYQLRGRVGRWNRRAYAYFLIPKNRQLSEITNKRLEAIATAGGYGGGMKVAMRDLEMRGAGDILGIEQSGHASDIGFHLYCKLLKRTMDALQGKATTWAVETKVDIPFDCRLPDFYVNDVTLRMEVYQRLGDASTTEEIDAIWTEVIDRFGKPPEPALWLYHFSRVRLIAASLGITTVKLDTLSISYEKHSGSGLVSNKVLIGKVGSPLEMEEKIVHVLRTRVNSGS